MKHLFFLFLLFACGAKAQDSGYGSIKSELKNAVKSVSTAGAEIEQSITFDDSKPLNLTFLTVSTDKKGKSASSKYVFNPADFNQNSVSYKIAKDIILVNVSTKGGSKYVQLFENDQFKGFVDKFSLNATDIDNARSLVDILKKMVPVAAKLEESQQKLPASFEALSKWLQENINTQELDGVKFEQSLKNENLIGTYTRAVYDVKGQTKGENTYTFNWGDFNAKAVSLDIKSKQLSVSVLTKNKKKFIKDVKSGELQNNTDELVFSGYDVDWVKMLKKGLETFIPLAEQRLASSGPKLDSYASAMKYLSKVNNTFQDKANTTVQALSGDCMAHVTISTSGKSNLEEEYKFFLGDINDKKLDLDVKGGLFLVELSALNNQKLLEYSKNGAKQNYNNSLVFSSDFLEDFRYIPDAFKKVIAECKAAKKSAVPTGGFAAKAAWLGSQIPNLDGEGESVSQSLAINPDCSFKYTETRSDAKKSVEMVYETSLKDINANAVTLDVSGKNVYVSLLANGKEKVIKTHKDGVPTAYSNGIKLQIDNIEAARNITEGFKETIKVCPK